MVESEVSMGFPNVEGYVMHTHIECNSPHSIMLWFHNTSDDLSNMINVQAYLFNAYIRAANVEINPFFPLMKSHVLKGEVVQGNQMSLLTVFFEKGEMSFLFEKACYVRSQRPLGPIPDELKKKLRLT